MCKFTVSIDDIIITNKFRNTNPKETKVNRECNKYKTNGKFEKPIILDNNNVLTDGYSRYLALRKLGIQNTIVEYR
jgi:hypothetical protein